MWSLLLTRQGLLLGMDTKTTRVIMKVKKMMISFSLRQMFDPTINLNGKHDPFVDKRRSNLLIVVNPCSLVSYLIWVCVVPTCCLVHMN